ncbi:MAG: hypothetical protein ACI92Z_002332, partial [Paracoccaceae bacterium]
MVVELDPVIDDPFCLEPVSDFVQVDGFLLEGSPEPFDEDVVHCPAMHRRCMSIRIGQARVSVHFRSSLSNAFAITTSFRMTA